MARKQVLDLDATSTVTFEQSGQEFQGYYLGFKTVTTDYGKSKFHVFSTDQGNVGIWGSRKLDEKLAGILDQTVKTGQTYMTFITYQGKVKLQGGRTMKKFIVDFDDEITLDASAVARKASEESEGAAIESDAPSSTNEDADELDDVKPSRNLAKGQPAKFDKNDSNRVQNLLSKK